MLIRRPRPSASQLAFNAWPGYVQAFIFVSGVGFLATEADRISFFFQSVPFCFYAIFAVLSTFLLGIEKPFFLGKRLAAAMQRSRATGQLDADGAEPLSARELQASHVPDGYRPHVLEFFLPLAALIGIAVGTFVVTGSPNVHWAFGAALLLAVGIALAKGMALKELMAEVSRRHPGESCSAPSSCCWRLPIGGINTQTGGAVFLVDQLGQSIPYFLLPVLLQLLTMIIRLFDRDELGHLCRGLSARHAARLGDCRGARAGPPRAVHDPVFCCGDGRQRVWRPVLARSRTRQC